MVYSGAWGKLIREKTRSRKSRDTVPLSQPKSAVHKQAAKLFQHHWYTSEGIVNFSSAFKKAYYSLIEQKRTGSQYDKNEQLTLSS